jgi:hypothetical protein
MTAYDIDEFVISAQGLVKKFHLRKVGDIEAVKGIDLQVRRGEVFGFRSRRVDRRDLLGRHAPPARDRARHAPHAGSPTAATDGLGLTIFGTVLPIWLEAAVLLAFGALMLGLAALNFRRRE